MGGAVKLASRLEHGAPPGGVLISYETHAHAKDEIYCEEHGPIRVKGHRLSDRDLRRVPQAARAAIRAELPHVRVEKALGDMRTEIERDMKLMGVTKVSQLSRDMLRFRSGGRAGL